MADAQDGGLRREIGSGMLLFFVLGDVLGAGIYARVGSVAREVGGAVWLPFVVALALAALTACSYLELVTRFPGAAGAALYVHRAFRARPLTFLVAFAVLASGLSSAGVAARAFAGRYFEQAAGVPLDGAQSTLLAASFLVVLAVVNFCGVTGSVRTNLVLTAIELTGLLVVVLVGVAALATGHAAPARTLTLRPGVSPLLAVLSGASVAFYALIGFEDAVNMAEETRAPARAFPRALLGGLLAAGLIYAAVGFVATAVVDPDTLARSSGPLLEVVRRSPVPVPLRAYAAVALVAVGNTALINLLMASRVLYGMAREGIVPAPLGRVHRGRGTPWVAIVVTTAVAVVLLATGDVDALGDTTVLLLLLVFTLVNISVLVLRRGQRPPARFVAPRWVPVLGAASCLALVTRQSAATFARAAALLLVGVALWGLNALVRRRAGGGRAGADGT